MRNIALALGIALVVFAVLFFPGLLRLGESIPPAVLALVVAYFVLARRTFKKVEAIFSEAARALQSMPPRVDLAVNTMQKAYAFAPHQIGVRSQIDTQIGVMHFLQKDFNAALPLLQRSVGFGYWLGAAMLAVIYYKKKDHRGMRKALDIMAKRAKKEGLAWNLYAYLLCQIGQKDEAQRILGQALKRTKDDPRISENLLALQNGKKMKMRFYKEQWYQFHLERPPVEQQQFGIGGRMSKIARRGRW